MACGCKKKGSKEKEKKSSTDFNSKDMQALIRQKIVEQIQKGTTPPKTPQ